MRPALFAAALFAAGCGGGPSAPALRNDPVFESAAGGFRLLMPEGWFVVARSEPPPGRLDKETVLAQYRKKGDGLAVFEVSALDLPESGDLAGRLAEPSFAVEKWEQSAPSEPTELGGRTALRYSFRGRAGEKRFAREVTVVRKGERVYLFTGLFGDGDVKSRDQCRRAAESVVWAG